MEGRLSPFHWTNPALSQQQSVDLRNQMQWTNETVVEETGREGLCLHNDYLSSSTSGPGPVATSFGPYSSVQTPGNNLPRHIVCLNQIFAAKDKSSSFANGFSICDVTFDKCEEDNSGIMLEQGRPNINPLERRNVGFFELKSHSISRENEQCKANGNLIASVVPEARVTNLLASWQDSRKGKVGDLPEQTNGTTCASSGGPGDSLICLELGKQAYPKNATGYGVATVVTASTSARRPRTAASGVQIPRCQVEGCKTDLTCVKDYHRRHKVCEEHSKAAKAIVASQEQRFCQQCSRFHVLSVFDEGKRSCRNRLEVHNKRRRKTQPDALLLNTGFPSSFQDPRSVGQFWPDGLPFLHHPMIPDMHNLRNNSDELTTMHGRRLWPRIAKVDDHSGYEYAMQGPGKERQAFLKSVSQHANDRLPVLLLQSPKDASSLTNDVGDQRVHQYLQEDFLNPNCQGSSLPFSSGSFSGLEVTPSATQDLGVLAYSGRALSLLCPQLWSSHTPMTVSLEMSTQSGMALDQPAHEDQAPNSHLSEVRLQQQHFNLTTDKLPSITSQSENFFASVEHPSGSTDSLEEHCIMPSNHVFNRYGNCESQPMFCMMQGHELRDSKTKRRHHVKQSIDLMQKPSSQLQSTCLQLPLGDFHLSDHWEGYKL